MKKSFTTVLLISTVFSSIAQARIESPTLSANLMTSHLLSQVNRDILNLSKEITKITAKGQQDIALSFSENSGNSGNDGSLSSSFGNFVAINTLTKPKNKFESSRGKVEETRDIGYRGYNRPIFHTKDQSEIANHSPSNPSYSLKREPLIVSTDTPETPYKKHRDMGISSGGNEDSPSQKANKLGSSVARNQMQSSAEAHESGVTSGVTKDAESSTAHVSSTSKTSMSNGQGSNHPGNQRTFVEPSDEKQIFENLTEDVGGKSLIHVASNLSATSTGEQTTEKQIFEDFTEDVNGKSPVHVASDLSATSTGEQNNKQELETGSSTANTPPPPPPPLTNTPPPPPSRPTAAQLLQKRALNSVKKDGLTPTSSSGRPDLSAVLLKNGLRNLKKTANSPTSSSTSPDKGEVARIQAIQKLTKTTGLVDELKEKVQQIKHNLKPTGYMDKLLGKTQSDTQLDTSGNQEPTQTNVTLQTRSTSRPGSSLDQHLKTQEAHDKTNKQGLNIVLRKTGDRERLVPPIVSPEVDRAIEVALLAQDNVVQDNSVTATSPASLINSSEVVEEPTVTTGEPPVTTTEAIAVEQQEKVVGQGELNLTNTIKNALVSMTARYQESEPELDITNQKENILESLQTHKDFFNYNDEALVTIRALVDSASPAGIQWLEDEISKAEWDGDEGYAPDAFLRAAKTKLKTSPVTLMQTRQVGKLGLDKGTSLNDAIEKFAQKKGLIKKDTAEEPKVPAIDLIDTNSTSGNVGSSTTIVTPGFTPPPPPNLSYEDWSASRNKETEIPTVTPGRSAPPPPPFLIGSDVVVLQEPGLTLPKVENENIENDVVVHTLPKVENGSDEAEDFVPPALVKPEPYPGDKLPDLQVEMNRRRAAMFGGAPNDDSDDEEDDFDF